MTVTYLTQKLMTRFKCHINWLCITIFWFLVTFHQLQNTLDVIFVEIPSIDTVKYEFLEQSV